MVVATAVEVAQDLGLEPHPEGGYFRETYRSEATVQTRQGVRSLVTSILFLVTSDRPSRLHRLAHDELWIHQAGAALELITLGLDEQTRRLGTSAGAAPQLLVPAGAWQAARVAADEGGPAWSLAACVVSPGFDYADFELADAQTLLREWPERADLIRALT